MDSLTMQSLNANGANERISQMEIKEIRVIRKFAIFALKITARDREG